MNLHIFICHSIVQLRFEEPEVYLRLYTANNADTAAQKCIEDLNRFVRTNPGYFVVTENPCVQMVPDEEFARLSAEILKESERLYEQERAISNTEDGKVTQEAIEHGTSG